MQEVVDPLNTSELVKNDMVYRPSPEITFSTAEDTLEETYDTERKRGRKVSILIWFVLFVLLCLLMYLGWAYFQNKWPQAAEAPGLDQSADKHYDGKSSGDNNGDASSEVIEDPIQDRGGKFTAVYSIPADVRWQDENWEFVVTAVHRMDEIVELITLEDGEGEASMSGETSPEEPMAFVVVELQITDSRPVGEQRQIPLSKYVNLRRDGRNVIPKYLSNVQLLPGQIGVGYAAFEVPSSEMVFLGLAGDLDNPYLLPIDFTTSDTQRREGYFSLQGGFIEMM